MQPRPRVLVVDDDAGIREIIRTRLQMTSFEVMIARNGNEALQRAASWRPDAMVLDINMPELDGFGVLERMRRSGQPQPPVMVLTARHAQEDVRRALQLGARDYLTKPFTEAQLAARVGRLLRYARQLTVPDQVSTPKNGLELEL